MICGLAMVYLAVSTGFTVNFHYCFGQLSSTSLGAPTSCANGKMKLKRPCCKTTHITISVKEKHLSGTSNTLLPLFAALLPVVQYHEQTRFTAIADIAKSNSNKAPPEGSLIHLYLSFRNFRI